MKKVFQWVGILLLAIFFQSGCANKEPEKNFIPPPNNGNEEPEVNNNHPVVIGSFVQDWLVNNWNDARWDMEYRDLKEAGMEYLIFSPSLQTDINGNIRTLYPSALTDNSRDLIEICLRNAQKHGFKIFISLNFHDRWWNFDYSPEWLYEQMEIGNKVADELIAKYKERYQKTMYGWYWVWEVDNLNWNTPERRETLANAMNINRDHLAAVTPDMPFMLSPFVNYRVSNSDVNRNLWEEVFKWVRFREGDIFAPQDCVGAGGLTLEMLPEWFSKMQAVVKTKPGVQFWANIEIFDQRFWTSATLDRFIKQMEKTKPYVSNRITFAYSHYYSPMNVNRHFHDTYVYYYKKGVLPEVTATDPAINAVIESRDEQQTVLKWDAPQNKTSLLGYRIYKDGVQIADLQCSSNNTCPNTYTDKNAGSGGIYTITTYNVVGNESIRMNFRNP